MRRFTAVLTQLAEEFNLAVIGIHNFSKAKRDVAGDAIIASNLQCSETQVRPALQGREQIKTAARIISGFTTTLAGKAYAPELIDHVWLVLCRLNRNPELLTDLVVRKSSSTLMRRIFYSSAVTISGRLRGHVGFSQRTNTPFQGLAADGNKLALFRLLRAGFQCCGFIHDEVLVLTAARKP